MSCLRSSIVSCCCGPWHYNVRSSRGTVVYFGGCHEWTTSAPAQAVTTNLDTVSQSGHWSHTQCHLAVRSTIQSFKINVRGTQGRIQELARGGAQTG